MNTDEKIKAISAVVALAGLFWGVISFIQVQAISAAKPYLEKKLAWCESAVETAASLANAETMDPAQVQRFWEMYFGVMGLIEKEAIKNAMIAFGHELKYAQPNASPSVPVAPPRILKTKSLALAHACRDELSREWSAQWARS